MSWDFRNDPHLRGLLPLLDGVKVVSFDVFDTLLLRSVHQPADVFLALGRRLAGEDPRFEKLPSEAFRDMRRETERRARRKVEAAGREDVCLREIYAEFATVAPDPRRLAEMEIEAEMDAVYLNPYVWDFLKHCRSLGKKIALVSDFQFEEADFRRLLEHAGVDFSCVDFFLVSAQWGLLKKTGGLFRKFLEMLPNTETGCVLHIGDNEDVDVNMARKLGMQSAWYPVVPQTGRGLLAMERHYGGGLDALESLRSLAMDATPQNSPDEGFWHRTGAGVVGPLYALFAEWVVDEAQRLGVRRVIGLMREGPLLAEAVRRAAENRGFTLETATLYASRHVVWQAGLENYGPETLKRFETTPQLRVGDLLGQFGLSAAKAPFADMASMRLRECREAGRFGEVESYLLSAPVRKRVLQNAAEQRQLLYEAAMEATGGQDAITLDVGFGGTIPCGVEKVLRAGGYAGGLHHRLLVGNRQNTPHLLDGYDLLGWLGTGGEHEHLLRPTYTNAPAFENLVSENVGSTLGYRRGANGRPEPVLAVPEFAPGDVAGKEAVRQGVFAFQDLWFALLRAQPQLLSKLTDNKVAFIHILRRLMTIPLADEAKYIGGMGFYDPFVLGEKSHGMHRDLDYQQLALVGPEAFRKESEQTWLGIQWSAGLIEKTFPGYHLARYLDSAFPSKFGSLRQLFSDYRRQGKRVAIYGAGQAGRAMAKIAWETNFPLAFLADNDEAIQGIHIHGFSVISPRDAVGQTDVWVLSPKGCDDDIIAWLSTFYKGHLLPELVLRRDFIPSEVE